MNGVKSFRIDLSKEPELRSELERAGFQFSDYDHSFWRATHGKHILTLYRTGSFVIQGKNLEEISNFLTKKAFVLPEPHPTPSTNQAAPRHIGTDESGKGDYFGPLAVAGVLVTTATRKELLSIGVKDGKRLSDPNIKKLAPAIKSLCPHSIIAWTPAKYNKSYETNRHYGKLYRILAYGHAQAIKNILKDEPCQHVISDRFGPERFLRRALTVRGIDITLEQRPHAENDIAVAAASILARDEYIRSLESLSLEYLIDLPPGASDKVIETGREFVLRHGPEKLREVAKFHFAITQYILNPDMVRETQSTDFNPELFMSIDD